VDISSTQYEDGLVDFNTVIATLRSLQVQQDVVATTRGRVANNLVQVYRSLGGGWETRGEQAPDELLPEETKDEMRNRVKAWNVVFDEPEK
jgi:outer membrane protein TolC